MGILEDGVEILKTAKEAITTAKEITEDTKEIVGNTKAIFGKSNINSNIEAEETEYEEVEAEELQQGNIVEIQDMDYLESTLKNYSTTLETLSKETDNKVVLVNSLKAQLEVISVAKNPSLCKSAFDLMIQSLSDAAEEVDDDKELRNIQKRAALMTNNMIFFFDAYIHYQEDKKSKEGQELLGKACDTLATTTNDIIKDIAKNPTIISNVGSLAFVSGKNLFKNIISEGWLKKIIDFIFKAKKMEELYSNYYDFLLTAIEKLERHKRLFGRSVVLAEMIHNKKKQIAEYCNPIPVEPDDYVSSILWPTLSILGIIIILFIILGIIKLINLTPANLDNAVKNLWTAIKYSAIADGVALVVTSIINIIRKISYNASVKECFRNRELMENKFAKIADLLYS